MGEIVEGIERAIFGEVTADDITSWLDQHISAHLSLHIQDVLFRSGRLAAVYGLELTNGTRIVAKVHRSADATHLRASRICQQLLAERGYPCPAPLGEVIAVDNRLMTLENFLEDGDRGDAHQGSARRAMAESLAQQMTMLQAAPVSFADFRTPPAWANYEHGPWPTPHDPILDFTETPPVYEWLDLLAAKAARSLVPRRQPDRLGHSDWVCQNVRFSKGKVSAAYDWDSLIAEVEPVLVGIVAGSFTEGSTNGSHVPTPDEVAAFVADYEACLGMPLNKRDQATAVAAATWVLSYNARCDISVESWGYPATDGSALSRLLQFGEAYLNVHW
jgi:hypothetical protein